MTDTSSTEDASVHGERAVEPAAVALRGITKRYGSLVANDGVSLHVRRGEILGLLGENGAGKSTLMKVLYGLTTPDEGTIEVGGRAVRLSSPADARRAGIGMVTQHFSLVLPMTVAQNVTLGATPRWVDPEALAEAVRRSGERFGIPVDPTRRVEDLSVGERQRVEILKALHHHCDVLILDEPTAVLTPSEVDGLFTTIRRLTSPDEGHELAVVIISHKLHEIRELCQRVCVLHRGTLVGEAALTDVDDTQLVRLMVGGHTPPGDLATTVAVPSGEATPGEATPGEATPGEATPGEVGRSGEPVGDQVAAGAPSALAIRAVVVDGAAGERPLLDRVTIAVAPGEIVGVAGVSGNGQSELIDAVTGMRRTTSGSIHVGDVNVTNTSPAARVRARLGRLAEDRHLAIVPDMSVAHNLALERLDDFRRGWRIDERAVTAAAQAAIEAFDIRATPGTRMGTLSGGNMQKVLLARALSTDPVALIVAQPTRGLDINATAYVHTQLRAARSRGAGVLLISEDLDELLALCDRLVVISEGHIVGDVPGPGTTHEDIGALMAGAGSA